MRSTRREFIRQSAGLAGLLASGCATAAASAPPPILVNQVGFAPAAGKFCVLQGGVTQPFEIVDVTSGQVVHRGELTPRSGDLGVYQVGDFCTFNRPGHFMIRAGASVSAPFVIDEGVYDAAVAKCIGYFAVQRCGDSKSGHHAPCHLDDGRRADNHQHQDVTGGWHDACDLRKWVSATIYGMIGLHRVMSLRRPTWDAHGIVAEMRWGNQYFRKMQEPAGYVMDYCGGDDGNCYTDNVIGDADDRLIHVDACELPAQFQFIFAEAAMARRTRGIDAGESRACQAAAQKCLDWCLSNRSPGAALSLGAAVAACVEMHRLSGAAQLPDQTARFLEKLIGLQVTRPMPDSGPPRGFFLTAPDKPHPFRDCADGNLPLLALCEALEYFPNHHDAGKWTDALKLHCDYLTAMSSRSAFGTIPYGLYDGADPGGNRKLGGYWYRWFLKTHNETSAGDWWVGVNAHLASCGVGLVRAGRLLKDDRLSQLAQRQLDWILGVNPFGASTVTDVGRDQPALYRPGAFFPPTPHIPGGVMNGIGGDEHDRPQLAPGSWQTCEYWTPMVCYTMWLMAELQTGKA